MALQNYLGGNGGTGGYYNLDKVFTVFNTPKSLLFKLKLKRYDSLLKQLAEVRRDIFNSYHKVEDPIYTRNIVDKLLNILDNSNLSNSLFYMIDGDIRKIYNTFREETKESTDAPIDAPTDAPGVPEGSSEAIIVAKEAHKKYVENLSKKHPELVIDGLPVTGTGRDILPTTEFTTTSEGLSSINISTERKYNANGAIAQFYNEYSIERYLNSGKLTTGTPIYIYNSKRLSENRKIELGEDVYNEAVNSGLILLVLDADGDFVIGDKHFQPIGVLADSCDPNSSGSDIIAALREQVKPGEFYNKTTTIYH